jgi:hypothetical protein
MTTNWTNVDISPDLEINSHTTVSRTDVDISLDSKSNSHAIVSRTNITLQDSDRDVFHDQVLGFVNSFGLLAAGPYAMSGVTRDSNGNALGGCTVLLISIKMGEPVRQTTSDANGNYTFYVRDNTTHYFVAAYKSGSPNVFGRTDVVAGS